MKRIACIISAALVAGCASINYGPLTVHSLGTDVSFGNAQWVKLTQTNGVVAETLTVQNANRNSTESIHTFANLSMAAIGALVGSPTGPAGAGAGAAVGASVTELYQLLKDYMGKSGTTNAPPVVVVPAPVPVPAPVSGPLIEPPYTADYMKANVDFEECSLERQLGVGVRCCVWSPVNGWWFISSVGSGHTSQAANGGPQFANYVKDGISYELKGYATDDPQSQSHNLEFPCSATPAKWMLIVCRKVN